MESLVCLTNNIVTSYRYCNACVGGQLRGYNLSGATGSGKGLLVT
jgi:hypothetical protein